MGIEISNVTKRHLCIVILGAFPALCTDRKLNVILRVTLRFGRRDERIGQLDVPREGVAVASIDGGTRRRRANGGSSAVIERQSLQIEIPVTLEAR